MNPHELSLAAGALPEFPAVVVAESAGRAGFGMAGFTVDPNTWAPQTTRRLQRLVDRWQLTVLDVEVVWIPPDGQLDDGHRLIVDVAGELGARNVLAVSSDADIERTAAALHHLCERAAPAGVRVALEFLMITAIRSLQDAVAVVRACDHPAAAVLVDALHLQRAGNRPEDLHTMEPRLLPYVQLCDGRRTCGDRYEDYLEDALDLRSAPGEGELPLGAFLEAVPENCPLSLEVRSRAWRSAYPDPTARAAALRERTLAFLDVTGQP